MGGKLAHEYMYRTPIGEDALILCDNCGYSANRQVAGFRKPVAQVEELKPLEKIHTPGCKSIDELANFLQIPRAKTAKAVFFIADIPAGKERIEKFIFSVVRGEMDLNETKLSNAVGARELRPATEEEILAVGAVPGYASPVGLKNVIVVVDDALPGSPNLVAGANEDGYHLLNTNYPRDYTANIITDITAAQEGQSCPECGSPLRMERGVEVGHIFKLGTRYSEALGCTFLDKDGQQKPIIMGSYGIGVGRLLACVAEEHHDEHGLVWPVTIAPYQVHLILLRGKGDSKCEDIALELYNDLRSAGIEVLFDDREESPGVKFNDADLIGLPLRITVSERALAQGGFEIKHRSSVDKSLIPRGEALAYIQSQVSALFKVIETKLKTVEYN
jgi:prolyl-tRNA synthetase